MTKTLLMLLLLVVVNSAIGEEPRVECPEADVSFGGSWFDPVPFVATWEDCGRICGLVTQCNFWTWGKQENGQDSHNYCYLYETNSGLYFNPAYISGERGCPLAN